MIRLFQKHHFSLTFLISLPLILLMCCGASSTVFDASRKWTAISINEHIMS